MAETRSTRKMEKQRRQEMRKKKRRRRVVFLFTEIIILAVLSVVAYGMLKLDKMDYKVLDEEKLEVYRDTGEFTNVALFGLDSREGEIDGGVRSDCMMIASINNATNEVKIVSVYRDTLMQQEDGTYEKANAAYSYGGPQEAIALLNRNLDMDIRKYVSVNFNALADVIDLLGGIEIDLTEEEMIWTRGYASETSEVVGRKTEELTHAGLQTLDGIQAVSYARVRKTLGDDFKRTERQRIVLQKVVEKAQKADIATLNRIIDKVFPQISTNFTPNELMGIAANALNYKIGEMSGFPFEQQPTDKVKGLIGSYVAAIGHANNVTELHNYLFGEGDYVPSEKVQEVDEDVIRLTGIKPEEESDTFDTEE